MAQLSEALPDVMIQSWAGRRLEVVHFQAQPTQQARVLAIVREKHPNVHAYASSKGVTAVFHPHWPKRESISQQLEEHEALWLQPLRYQEGWEYYDVISLEDQPLQAYLQTLMERFPLEIVSRGSLEETALLSAFFVPVNPILEKLTEKQRAAFLAAWVRGYYRQPRESTTREIASRVGMSRSAFEERLRNAENHILDGIARLIEVQQGGTAPRPAIPPYVEMDTAGPR